jgi:hypothetical protein
MGWQSQGKTDKRGVDDGLPISGTVRLKTPGARRDIPCALSKGMVGLVYGCDDLINGAYAVFSTHRL